MQTAARGGRLEKEKPFIMGKPAREVLEDSNSEVMVLIQGIVDVFFEEEGALVLVDYKTDSIRSKEQLLDRYKKQLDLYQEALERATGKRVKEKILYSFGLQEEIYV
jgi:ATP-dependent helicase/nuclease subunit A